MKITCFKLQESYNDLDEILSNEVEILSETKEANDKFIELESFQGTAADNLQGYFAAIHGTIIGGLMLVCADLNVKLMQLFDDYYVDVDKRQSSVICTEYIGDKVEKLSQIEDSFADVTGTVQEVLSSISDIFSTASSYKTYEDTITTNLPATRVKHNDVITDLVSFNMEHLSDCDAIISSLEEIIAIINAAQDIFVDNRIGDYNELCQSDKMKSLEENLGTITDSIQEHPHWFNDIAEELNKTLTEYGAKKALAQLGIAGVDLWMLYAKGLWFDTRKDGEDIILQIRSTKKANLTSEEIGKLLRGQNIHIEAKKFNKLIGDGLAVKTKKINSPILNKFDRKAGFDTISSTIKNDKHKFPDIWENKGFKYEKTLGNVMKGVDIVGYGVMVYQNAADNCYNSKTGEWEGDWKSAGDAVIDTVTEVAVDQGIQLACAAIGTAICPGPGTAIGYAIGSAVSAGLQAEWWFTEPPKSTVDFVKDGVKDAAHYVCDKLARIFW